MNVRNHPVLRILCRDVTVRKPLMLLKKKSFLQCGKSPDSLDYEGIEGFRHDGHPNGTGSFHRLLTCFLSFLCSSQRSVAFSAQSIEFLLKLSSRIGRRLRRNKRTC